MLKATILLLVLAVGVFAAQAAFASNPVRISQVYGGGGNTGATYDQDYVELFNSSGVAVNIGGWSLQYGASTSTLNLGACTNCLTVFPTGATIPACGYYLIGLAKGTVAAPPLPVTPDLSFPTGNNLSATTGKIGLKADAITTPCSPQTAFVDLVGYGPFVNCYELSPAWVLSNTSMDVRYNAGLVDTDSNIEDFALVTAAVPRNSASPINPGCSPIAVEPRKWSDVKFLYR
jgi:hypothetical protein